MTEAETAVAVGRQPLLSDATMALRAPTQVWSRSSGEVGEAAVDGVYFGDTRYLRRMTLRCSGRAVEWISASPDGASRIVFGGLLRELDDEGGADPLVRVLRDRTVTATGMTEAITIRSHVDRDLDVHLEIELSPEFSSLTEVKAGIPSSRPATILVDPVDGADSVLVQSGGQAAVIVASGADRSVVGGAVRLAWDVAVPARAETGVAFSVTLSDPDAVVAGAPDALDPPHPAGYGDRRLDAWTRTALADLAALRLVVVDEPGDAFYAAGAPWFFTLFGRDSLWTARLLLPAGTAMAASTLRALARRQGTRSDVETAEQPGKILHELRSAPVALPDGVTLPPTYYGTVDATALWVCLLHDAWRAGMDESEVRALLPAMKGCLDWLVHRGDGDGDGFLDYRDESGHGLSNQGWKDSGDAIQWRDGRLAEGPIALCEVQGYAYEAAISGAEVLDAFGEDGGADLRTWAAALRRRFAESYWVTTPEGRYPAVALDRHKHAVDTLTSNVGHLLGTGILDASDERHLADLLTGPTMLSGYGVRTLSTRAAGYWPLSYHGGSVWAHDTAVVARGMHRAGLGAQAVLVASQLLDAAEGFGYRMPELHSGDAASQTSRPTPYPAACRPQAWSAAAAVTVAEILEAPPGPGLSRPRSQGLPR